MKLNLLYLDGCTAWHQVLETLRQALRAEGVEMEVSLVRVIGARHAKALRFRGCPSIRLDDQDIFKYKDGESNLFCQLYQTAEGLQNWPTIQMIRNGLRNLGVLAEPYRSGRKIVERFVSMGFSPALLNNDSPVAGGFDVDPRKVAATPRV